MSDNTTQREADERESADPVDQIRRLINEGAPGVLSAIAEIICGPCSAPIAQSEAPAPAKLTMDERTTAYHQGYQAGIEMGKALAADEAAPEAPASTPKCVICHADEPRTGTCGSDDPRALCNQATTFALCMLVAEAAYKEGSGHDRAVARDKLRPIVDEVLNFTAEKIASGSKCIACDGTKYSTGSVLPDGRCMLCNGSGVEPTANTGTVPQAATTASASGDMSLTMTAAGIDANKLEAMAKEMPDECFLKGSGVLKLIAAIRYLESAVGTAKRGTSAALPDQTGESPR